MSWYKLANYTSKRAAKASILTWKSKNIQCGRAFHRPSCILSSGPRRWPELSFLLS